MPFRKIYIRKDPNSKALYLPEYYYDFEGVNGGTSTENKGLASVTETFNTNTTISNEQAYLGSTSLKTDKLTTGQGLEINGSSGIDLNQPFEVNFAFYPKTLDMSGGQSYGLISCHDGSFHNGFYFAFTQGVGLVRCLLDNEVDFPFEHFFTPADFNLNQWNTINLKRVTKNISTGEKRSVLNINGNFHSLNDSSLVAPATVNNFYLGNNWGLEASFDGYIGFFSFNTL